MLRGTEFLFRILCGAVSDAGSAYRSPLTLEADPRDSYDDDANRLASTLPGGVVAAANGKRQIDSASG